MTLTAFPIKSAGRFWPCGPLGTAEAYTDERAGRIQHPPADRAVFVGSTLPVLAGAGGGRLAIVALREPRERRIICLRF